jgi:hypothetical protein
MVSGIEPQAACRAAVIETLSDDDEMRLSMVQMLESVF